MSESGGLDPVALAPEVEGSVVLEVGSVVAETGRVVAALGSVVLELGRVVAVLGRVVAVPASVVALPVAPSPTSALVAKWWWCKVLAEPEPRDQWPEAKATAPVPTVAVVTSPVAQTARTPLFKGVRTATERVRVASPVRLTAWAGLGCLTRLAKWAGAGRPVFLAKWAG